MLRVPIISYGYDLTETQVESTHTHTHIRFVRHVDGLWIDKIQCMSKKKQALYNNFPCGCEKWANWGPAWGITRAPEPRHNAKTTRRKQLK